MTAAATLDSGDGVISALEPPEVDESDSVKELVESAGWEVSAVDWVFEHVTGESLVTKVIEPLTGDFGKIAANAEAWGKVHDAVKQFSQTMTGNAKLIGQQWTGSAATAHEMYVQAGWRVALLAEAGIATAIGKGFDAVAKGSKKLAQQAIQLLKKVVDKLLDAVAKLWAPVAGWIAAAEIVWDAYQIYQKILDIIEAVKDILRRVGQMWDSLKDIGSQLAKIKDVHSFSDLAEIGGNIAGDVGDIAENAGGVAEDVGQIRDDAKEIKADYKDAQLAAEGANFEERAAIAKQDAEAEEDGKTSANDVAGVGASSTEAKKASGHAMTFERTATGGHLSGSIDDPA